MARKRVSEKEIILSAPMASRHKPASSKRVKRTVASPDETPATTVVPEMPTNDEIATLAYSYWEARGCQGGSAEADWLRAEQELAARKQIAAAIA